MSFSAISAVVLACAAQQAARGIAEFNQRIRQAELERSAGNLAATEAMLAGLEKAIDENGWPKVWQAAVLDERALLRDDEGLPAEAISFYERALAIVREQHSPSDRFLGLTLANLAAAHVDCKEPEIALSLSEEAMTLLRKASPPDYATALYAHGMALHGMGRDSDALHDLREALAMRTAEAKPDNTQIAVVDEAIGSCLATLGYLQKAEAAERDAVAVRSRYSGPDSLGVGASLNNLAVMLAGEKRYSEAEESLQKAIAILERAGDAGVHRLLGVLANLGALYSLQAAGSREYSARAEKVYRRALEIEQQVFGDSDVRASSTLEALGEVLYQQRSYNEAAALYHRGLTLQQTIFGAADPRTQAAEKRYRALAKKAK